MLFSEVRAFAGLRVSRRRSVANLEISCGPARKRIEKTMATSECLQLECKLCRQQQRDFVSWSLQKMIQHTQSSHAMTAVSGGRFVCCLPRCNLGKPHLKQWIDHVEICMQLATAGHPAGEDVFECCCGERAFTPKGLLKHICRHLKAKEPITCPYRNCIYRFGDYLSFYRHRKSSHVGEEPRKVQSTRTLRTDQPPVAADSPPVDLDCSMADMPEDAEIPYDPNPFIVPLCARFENSAPSWFVGLDSGLDTRKVLLYLAMNATFKVPKVKIPTAFQQIDIFANVWASNTYPELFAEVLRCNSVDPNAIDRITSQLTDAVVRHPPHSAFYETGTVVSSSYRVTKFMKSHMRYVHPEDIVPVMRMATGHCPLVKGSGVFVDVEKNLTFFVNNNQVSELILDSFREQSSGNLSGRIGSYLDGTNCKKIRNESPEGVYIDICLYADEAEPLNPLGLFSLFFACLTACVSVAPMIDR